MKLSTHFEMEFYGEPVHELHIEADVTHDGAEYVFRNPSLFCLSCHDVSRGASHDWSELTPTMRTRVEDGLAALYDRAVAELESAIKREVDTLLPWNLRHLLEAGADSEAQNLLAILRALNSAGRAAKRKKEAA